MKHNLQMLAILTLLVLGSAAMAYVVTRYICAPVEVGPYPPEK